MIMISKMKLGTALHSLAVVAESALICVLFFDYFNYYFNTDVYTDEDTVEDTDED